MPSCADPWSCAGPKVASPGPGRGRRASGRPPRSSTRARRQERRNCRPALPCLQSRQAGAAVNRTRCHKLIWIRGDLYRPWSSACGTTSAGRCLRPGRAWAASPRRCPNLPRSARVKLTANRSFGGTPPVKCWLLRTSRPRRQPSCHRRDAPRRRRIADRVCDPVSGAAARSCPGFRRQLREVTWRNAIVDNDLAFGRKCTG
jgi:hypothetical protein